MKVSKKTKLKNRHKILASVAFFVCGGAISSCLVMAFFYFTYPSAKNSLKTAVAGESSIIWYKPVLKSSTLISPQVSAEAGILIDADSGEILWAKNQLEPRPVASLTKLVTALAFLKSEPNLEESYKVPADFNSQGKEMVEPGDNISSLKLNPGDKVTYKDLLFSALVGSANNAALALSKIMGDQNSTVERLNNFAHNYGAIAASFQEASGLDPDNTASAMDYAILTNIAFKNPIIAEAAGIQAYDFKTENGQSKRVINTDKLLNSQDYEVIGGKTGYLAEAGYNFVIAAEKDSHSLILVLLGCPTSADRFAGADSLLKWGFDGHVWQAQRLVQSSK